MRRIKARLLSQNIASMQLYWVRLQFQFQIPATLCTLSVSRSLMMARLLSLKFRSLASSSFFFNQPRHISIAATSSSSLNTPKHHQRWFLFSFSSFPRFPDHPNSTSLRFFSSQPKKAATLTSIVHELAEAGRTKEALDAFLSFIEADIIPESHDYNVLIKALAADPSSVGDAKQCVLDIVRDGLRIYRISEPAYMAVYGAFVRQGKAKKGKEFLKEIKAKGLWGCEEKAVREALWGQTELEVQSVLDIVMDDSDDENEDNTVPVEPEDMHAFFLKNFDRLYPFTHHCAVMEMFNALMEDGLTDEAMEIRAYILENSKIPSVALFTNQIVYCARAGEAKLAIEKYHQMIRCCVTPNAYTYSILIKALAADPKFIGDAKKYLLEMMDKGMRPNARTYTAVLDAFDLAGKAEECREILEQMRAKGIVVDEGVVSGFQRIRGALRNVMNALFGK